MFPQWLLISIVAVAVTGILASLELRFRYTVIQLTIKPVDENLRRRFALRGEELFDPQSDQLRDEVQCMLAPYLLSMLLWVGFALIRSLVLQDASEFAMAGFITLMVWMAVAIAATGWVVMMFSRSFRRCRAVEREHAS